MKLAIIGSRTLTILEMERYIPAGVTEIVSGGARGIDTCAARYARTRGLKLTVFLPEYEKYGKRAPLRRNDRIIKYADSVLAFWDGHSRGTGYVIERCREKGKEITVWLITESSSR